MNISNLMGLELPLLLFCEVFEDIMACFSRFLSPVPFPCFYIDFPFSRDSIDHLLNSCDWIAKNFTSARGVVLKGSFC